MDVDQESDGISPASLDVSVIVPAYNSMPYVAACIESVIGQSIGLDRMELIVVDDGSTDGTGEELERLATTWDGMRVIHTENSGGPAAPRNIALDIATGRYIFMLDADDYLGLEALERMVAVADREGTDVVLGRLESVGGREIPQSMFADNQPNTNVFDSRIYYALNPMKLYRRELIERLNLRFLPNAVVPLGSDQPFVATVYFNASGVSVIADYPCVYFRLRDDGMNRTTLADLSGYMKCLEIMMKLVPDNVPPGRDRDHLLRRHFGREVLLALQSLCAEIDVPEAAASFARIKQWVDELYNAEIGMQLRPLHRITYDLVGKGRLHDLVTLFSSESSGAERIQVVTDGVIYDPYPFFRTSDVPDECYENTRRTRGHRRLTEVEWESRELVLRGYAYIDRLDDALTTKTLVLRKRDTEIEYELPIAPWEAPQQDLPTEEPGLPGGFEARIDVTSVANGAPLDLGLWDLRMRLENSGVVRDARFGANRVESIDATPRVTLVGSKAGVGTVVTPYYTKDYGNLTLDVGEARQIIELEAGGATWSTSTPPVIEVTGTVTARLVSDNVAVLVLNGPDGQIHHVPVRAQDTENGSTLVARLAPSRAASGTPLPEGDWHISMAVDVGGEQRSTLLPAGDGLQTVRWWSGLRPMHLRSVANAEGGLVVRVRRVNLMAAMRRRLRSLFVP